VLSLALLLHNTSTLCAPRRSPRDYARAAAPSGGGRRGGGGGAAGARCAMHARGGARAVVASSSAIRDPARTGRQYAYED
jgi:hypothetical protein